MPDVRGGMHGALTLRRARDRSGATPRSAAHPPVIGRGDAAHQVRILFAPGVELDANAAVRLRTHVTDNLEQAVKLICDKC